jgi:hypothetical protein
MLSYLIRFFEKVFEMYFGGLAKILTSALQIKRQTQKHERSGLFYRDAQICKRYNPGLYKKLRGIGFDGKGIEEGKLCTNLLRGAAC